jgi:hypothetical protein
MSAKKPAAAGAERGMLFLLCVLLALTSAKDLDPDLTKLLNELENAEVIKQKLKEEEIYTLARAKKSLTEAKLEKLGFKMGTRDAILELLHRML